MEETSLILSKSELKTVRRIKWLNEKPWLRKLFQIFIGLVPLVFLANCLLEISGIRSILNEHDLTFLKALVPDYYSLPSSEIVVKQLISIDLVVKTNLALLDGLGFVTFAAFALLCYVDTCKDALILKLHTCLSDQRGSDSAVGS